MYRKHRWYPKAKAKKILWVIGQIHELIQEDSKALESYNLREIYVFNCMEVVHRVMAGR